ncbi:hypothetical protein V6N13_024276 [Hibiscus sabdariffa]
MTFTRTCVNLRYVSFSSYFRCMAVQRPSTDYMETVQRDINVEMRASLIDGLLRATENKRILLPPETLCMAVNYIDRYLSSISINRQQLQLLGLACMLIAYKHESVKSAIPKVIVLCNITGKTYHKAKIVQMESAVLNHLDFEMSVPTAYYFLAQFICAAKTSNHDHPLQWECLSSYILELSLVEYSMLQYAQPLIAASAAFLARFILSPLEKPWDSKLRGYTLYQPSDLVECVMALHRLYRTGGGPNSTAIRSKYGQSKYFFVATRDCHATIPDEFFQDVSSSGSLFALDLSAASPDSHLDKMPVFNHTSTLVSTRFQASQVGEEQSIKGEVAPGSGTSKGIKRAAEESVEMEDCSGNRIFYHPCHYLKLAFLKCLGLDSSSETFEQRKQR